MAIDVKETYTRTAETNERFQRSYTRTFRVVTDDPRIDAGAVREAVGIAVGDTYSTGTEYDDGAFCLNKSASCTAEDGKQWVVTVSYGPPPDTSDPNSVENPLLQPYEISWGFAQFERPVEYTIYGEPICNTLGDPFSTAIMRDDSRPVLSITRNEAFFPAGLAYLLRDCVNSDSFMGAGPGQAKVSNISSQRQFNSNFGFYWKTSYEFTFDAGGYDKFILNAGTREFDPQAGLIKNILSQGIPITEPALLDQFGRELQPGMPPYIRRFKVYFEVPFSIFNF